MKPQLQQILSRLTASPQDALPPLQELAAYFREEYRTEGNLQSSLEAIASNIQETPDFGQSLKERFNFLLEHYRFYSFFTQFSFLDQSGFLNGVWSRIKHKVVPQLPEKTDFQYFLREVFDLKQDAPWLLELINTDPTTIFPEGFTPDTRSLERELQLSIQTLGVKISSFGLDHRVRSLFQRLELDNRPFAALQLALGDELSPENINRAQSMLDAIRANILSLRLRKNEIGTTLKLTYESKKVLDKLVILKDLLALRANWHDKSAWIQVFNNAWTSQTSKMGLRRFVDGHLDLLSLEIVEHTAKSGEKYIAENRKEYFGIFRASMLGGLLIAFFAAGKIMLYDLKLAELPEAFLFSLNYATCFVLVKAMGGIIATKQPAMTASTIIKTVDQNNNLELSSLQEIIFLIKKASRSQFISFVGNLAVAFPLAIAIAWGYGAWAGEAFISVDKGEKLLESIWPLVGGAVPYAAIAGVFLALSGLISGYFDNKVVASNIEARLIEQPLLKRLFSLPLRQKISAYICKNLGGLSGNISLGFLLGMAGYVGWATGLPIDIRHIAFSSANFGFAFYTIPIDPLTILLGALSILLIGAVNFSVSFGITLYLTLKSRGITFANTFKLLWKLLWAMVLRPWEFILAGREDAPVAEG